jgi:hypothetical protein
MSYRALVGILLLLAGTAGRAEPVEAGVLDMNR